jgi:hypothetical protein
MMIEESAESGVSVDAVKSGENVVVHISGTLWNVWRFLNEFHPMTRSKYLRLLSKPRFLPAWPADAANAIAVGMKSGNGKTVTSDAGSVIKKFTDLEGNPIYVRAEAINLVRAPFPGEYGTHVPTGDSFAGAVIVIGASKIAVRETALSVAATLGFTDIQPRGHGPVG